MKRFVPFSLFAMLALPAFAQDNTPALPAAPISPIVLPPEVPQRPPLVVVPPAVNTGMPVTAAVSRKEPLAWRAKAHQLRLSNAPLQRQIATNYDAAIMSLISALSQSGMRVQTLNSKAGEVLAVPADGRSSPKVVFVLAEMPPGTVTIKASGVGNNKTAPAAIDAIFQALTRPQFAGAQGSPK